QWYLGNAVGADIHENATCKLLYIEKTQDIGEIARLMREYGVHSCVIDRHPEPRTALDFCNKFYGHARMCMFGQGITSRDIKASLQEQHSVLVDRTSWIDETFSRIRRGKEAVMIPYDAPKEYWDQMQVPARLYKKDKDGNSYGYYDNGGLDDHFAFAQVYNEIALTFAASMKKNTNLSISL